MATYLCDVMSVLTCIPILTHSGSGNVCVCVGGVISLG